MKRGKYIEREAEMVIGYELLTPLLHRSIKILMFNPWIFIYL